MEPVWVRQFDPPVGYRTSGTGQWCLTEAWMLVQDLVLAKDQEDYYYLWISFDHNYWDVAIDGYVVNDPGWNQCLRNHLRLLKFSDQAVAAVDFEDMQIAYQTNRQVVVPVGKQFALECDRLMRFLQGETENESV